MHKIEINSKWIMNCLSVYDDLIMWLKLSVAGCVDHNLVPGVISSLVRDTWNNIIW